MRIPRPWLHAARLAGGVLFYPALLVVIWGELTPSVPDPLKNENDKLLHFIAYFGLSSLAAAAIRRRGRAVFACLGLIALGGILEIVQGFVGRDMSLADEIANSIGVVVGGAGMRVLIEPLRRRLT